MWLCCDLSSVCVCVCVCVCLCPYRETERRHPQIALDNKMMFCFATWDNSACVSDGGNGILSDFKSESFKCRQSRGENLFLCCFIFSEKISLNLSHNSTFWLSCLNYLNYYLMIQTWAFLFFIICLLTALLKGHKDDCPLNYCTILLSRLNTFTNWPQNSK